MCFNDECGQCAPPLYPFRSPEDELGAVQHVWLQDEEVASVAKKIGKTPAQVLLQWGLSHGHSVIPKSGNARHIKVHLIYADFLPAQSDCITAVYLPVFTLMEANWLALLDLPQMDEAASYPMVDLVMLVRCLLHGS